MELQLIFNKILTAGVSDYQNEYTNQKIRLSNGIALYFVGMVAIYIVISLIFIPEILPFVIVSGLLFCSVPFLNASNNNYLARFITATNPAIVSFFIHISIITKNDVPITGNYLIQLSFILLPWILFDFKDKILLVASFILCVLAILLVKPLNGLVEPFETNPLAYSPKLENIFMFTACSIVCATLYILQYFNAKTELKNQKLFEETEKTTEALKANEKKLNDYISQIEETRIEDKKREWANNGLAMFAEILRQNNETVKQTYDNIIRNIVKYLDANQGGLFVVEESNHEKYLSLEACYAYDRKKFLEKRIDIGEGMVGQCYLEKDITLITKVPDRYTYITSGLGASTPGCILVLPLMVNEEVYGVVELASFKKFEQYQVDFLKKLAESIASAIGNLKINERTKVLLSQSMQQTEEMRAQEEEMRQNMEELSATQEEMRRKEVHLMQVLEEARKKEAEMAEMAFKHRDEVESIQAKVEMLELKLKRKDKKIEELESLLTLN
ncbi:MAG: GAF domain-containing protein [Bacteroidota bacterium]|nr:GAF domain-containing protein [Bacteroidota bacterium]